MANYKTDMVDIDLDGGNLHRSFLNRTIGEGDKLANRFGIRAFRGGTPENIGGNCSGYFIRPDGGTVVITGTVSGNEAYVVLPQACYAYEGNFTLAVKVGNGTDESTLRIVDGVVATTTTDAVVDPGTIIPSVEDLIDAIEAAVATIPADYSGLWTTIAPAFSSDYPYSVGDYVTHNGKMYRFIADHSGSWADADVTETKVSAEFGRVYDGFDMVKQNTARADEAYESVTEKVLGSRFLAFKIGMYQTNAVGNVSEYEYETNHACAICPCEEGDVFTARVHGRTGEERAWAFLDEDMKVVSRAGANVDLSGTVTAPASAAYVVFNNRMADLGSGFYAYKGNGTIDTEINGIEYDIGKIKDALGTYEVDVTSAGTIGYYWNSQGTTAVSDESANYKKYDAIECQPGETYKVWAYDATSNKQNMVLVTDEDMGILSRYGERDGSYKTYTFRIPEGGAYILITTNRSVSAYCHRVEIANHGEDTSTGTFPYKGATVAIIGDSISTNGDWSAANKLGNVPEIVIEDADVGVQLSAYVTYYDIGTVVGGHEISDADVGNELTFTPTENDVGKIVGKPKNNNAASVVTWWEVAAEQLGFDTIPVCWSGASITSHEENDQEDGHYVYKCAHAWHDSQIRKCGIRTAGSMTRTAPDMVIIYRGTNDLTHSPYSRITDYMDNWPNEYPEGDTSSYGGSTVYDYAKGIRLTIKKLRDAYPETKVVLCTLNYFRRIHTDKPFTYNDYDNWMKYNAMIRKIAEAEGCDLIEFDKDGLTWSNAANDYYQEGSSSTAKWTHPTTKGHKVLGNRALRDLTRINGKT